MSVYAAFDDGPGDQVASNRGWGDFCRWVDSLPASYGKLKRLVEDGQAKTAGLSDLLEDALREHGAPHDVETTVAGFIALLDSAEEDADAVFVTNGGQR